MADAADSKSVALKSVRVQVPPPALLIYKELRVSVKAPEAMILASGAYFGAYSFFVAYFAFFSALTTALVACLFASRKECA